MNIETRHDSKRGCGWRKPGGLYMISGGVSAPCGLLPIPLTVCPTCSCGIKQTRGWTWINISALIQGRGFRDGQGGAYCGMCPLGGTCPLPNLNGKHGLLWVGGVFYEKPQDWTNEAIRQGVSRRIAAVPKDFKLGETWVFVAHKNAIPQPVVLDGDPNPGTPGIFHAFIPTAIEYVVKGDETEEEFERMVKRGITPVKVERVGEQQDLPVGAEDETEVLEEVQP